MYTFAKLSNKKQIGDDFVLQEFIRLEFFVIISLIFICSTNLYGQPQYSGIKGKWLDEFDRYDYIMDESTTEITPFKPAQDEALGFQAPVEGKRRCVIVAPKSAAVGKPWSWRGHYWGHEPQTEIELLKRGFHIVYIETPVDNCWDAWYSYLTEKHGFSKKPAFIGMSRGGINSYKWATKNPDKVSCIYADNPAIGTDDLMKLESLVQNNVPLLNVCGSLDPILGNGTLKIEQMYRMLGGRISVMIQEGLAHHPHSLRDATPLADFIEKSQQPYVKTPPSFAEESFTKSYFYTTENKYIYYPPENTYITCRGPLFNEFYERIEFRRSDITGSISVIVPNNPAPGKPWVFRANYVTTDALVDLALLAKGFHIVTGPCPTNIDGPVLEQWNLVYQFLTEQGFSKKPVLEGDGKALGEAYGWAIENPDKVSCIYGENPVFRAFITKKPLLENLSVLAMANVPIIFVSGSLDPWYVENTIAVEKQYIKIGGQIKVITNEGAGHYPLAPKEIDPIVEMIVKNSK